MRAPLLDMVPSRIPSLRGPYFLDRNFGVVKLDCCSGTPGASLRLEVSRLARSHVPRSVQGLYRAGRGAEDCPTGFRMAVSGAFRGTSPGSGRTALSRRHAAPFGAHEIALGPGSGEDR